MQSTPQRTEHNGRFERRRVQGRLRSPGHPDQRRTWPRALYPRCFSRCPRKSHINVNPLQGLTALFQLLGQKTHSIEKSTAIKHLRAMRTVSQGSRRFTSLGYSIRKMMKNTQFCLQYTI
jgi:hypothetical protein